MLLNSICCGYYVAFLLRRQEGRQERKIAENIHLLQIMKNGRNVMELLKIIFAILLPPLGVFMQVGIGKHFWINLLLTLLGYLPGIVHAIWVIAKKK